MAEICKETGATIIRTGNLCKVCGAWIPFENHGTYCKERK